jgi:hypothetical protein
MKKIFAILLCVAMIFAMPVVAFAEDVEAVETDVSSEEGAPNVPEKSEAEREAELTTQKIISYIQEHLEELSVILTLILTVFYQIRKHSALNKSIRITNNNAIAVAENSEGVIREALNKIKSVGEVVNGYKDEISKLLSEIRVNEEEKQKFAAALSKANGLLETSKAATLELSNEVAELLILANIPNSKKEELYSRHRAAVDAIAIAEKSEENADETREV